MLTETKKAVEGLQFHFFDNAIPRNIQSPYTHFLKCLKWREIYTKRFDTLDWEDAELLETDIGDIAYLNSKGDY